MCDDIVDSVDGLDIGSIIEEECLRMYGMVPESVYSDIGVIVARVLEDIEDSRADVLCDCFVRECVSRVLIRNDDIAEADSIENN